MRITSTALALCFFTALFAPGFVHAQDASVLRKVYESRGDLQAAFEIETLRAIPGTAAGFLIDVEDWARQYGWREYPELAAFAPAVPSLRFVSTRPVPTVTSDYYIVIDNATGDILAAQGAEQLWPIASITKLMTSKVAIDQGLDLYGVGNVLDADDVGGAKLYANSGSTFYTMDLLRATLIASANNAANAVARLSGLSKGTFIERMNSEAERMNLGRTRFVDPTGIELGNVSTAREVAFMAREIFEDETVRRFSGTSALKIQSISNPEYDRAISSTNWLLYDRAYDDVYVTAGKTGYLNESGWNLVVRMHPMDGTYDESVLIVLFGGDSRRESFDDAASLARWAWQVYDWDRQ